MDAYRLKIPGTDGLSYFPEVTFKREADGILTPYVDKIDPPMFLGIYFFVIGLAAMAGYFRMKSEMRNYLLPAALLFFFAGYALWYIGFISGSIITPTDETHYFTIARQLLAGDFTSKYRYTIGFPIFCIPFVYLFHLQDGMEFVLVFMKFQTFILIPVLLLLLYRFFYEKMGCSRIQSFSILLYG